MLLNKNPSEKQLIGLFSIFGLLTAIWIIYGLHGSVDEDGVFYLEIAKRFVAGDYQGGLQLYNWAFFPWLIAITGQITGLSLQYSAHLLEALFFSVTTWSLLSLIHEGGGTKLTIFLGAVLLFSSEYVVGHVLSWIMRDQGFWAFYLLGLLYFFRFHQFGKFSDAILWQVMTLIAALFRVEAICFLLLLPFSLLFKNDLPFELRLKLLAQAYSINLLAIAGAILVLLLNVNHHYIDALGRIAELQSRIISTYYQITTGIAEKADIFGSQILNTYTDGYALYGIWLTLVLVVLGKLVSATGILTTALAAAGLRDRQIHPQLRTIFFWAAAINLLNASVSMLSTFVVMGRYLVGLTFILIVFAAFFLSGFIRRIGQVKFANLGLRYKISVCIVLLLIINSFYKNYTSDPSQDYRQGAIAWIKQHKEPNDKVYYSDARLRYYADETWSGREKNWSLDIDGINNQATPYEYLVLAVNGDIAKQQLQLIDKFKNYRIVKKCTNRGKSFTAILKYQHPA